MKQRLNHFHTRVHVLFRDVSDEACSCCFCHWYSMFHRYKLFHCSMLLSDVTPELCPFPLAGAKWASFIVWVQPTQFIFVMMNCVVVVQIRPVCFRWLREHSADMTSEVYQSAPYNPERHLLLFTAMYHHPGPHMLRKHHEILNNKFYWCFTWVAYTLSLP